MARKTKDEVRYTPRAMNPAGKCSRCAHFYTVGAYEAGRCTRVEGEISPEGWCELFKAL